MLAKTGLLIVSNPKNIGKILSNVQKNVKNTLYIQLLSMLSEPLSFHQNLFSLSPKYSQTIWGIYSQAAQYCQELDVRVILSSLKYQNLSKIQTRSTIEVVIFDKIHNQTEIDAFVRKSVENISSKCGIVTIENDVNNEPHLSESNENIKIYKHAVLGGTFDRLHIAHKILLSEAALRSSKRITVGVTEENMLQSKTLWELIQPVDVRMEAVRNFMNDICPELDVSVVPIADLYGPTQDDPTMELLVLSAETVKGGQKINEVRQSKGLPVLDILPVPLVDEPNRNPLEEEKISSSTARMRLLGELLKPIQKNDSIPKTPYVIGLTGGIASGKSGIIQYLQEFGAEVIDCDKVAHELYHPGMKCHKLIVENFGNGVLTSNGEIDRKILGGIVFNNPAQLEKLNSLVWPNVHEEVIKKIKNCKSKVVIVEAAVLQSAGLGKLCHEIWATIIPREEAIKRLEDRNGLTEEQARSRIMSQQNNQSYVENANVVFCSLWTSEFTKSQVVKAWSLLQGRISS